jgi:hypothetical protein
MNNFILQRARLNQGRGLLVLLYSKVERTSAVDPGVFRDSINTMDTSIDK